MSRLPQPAVCVPDFAAAPACLVAEDLCVSFGTTVALDGVDLAIVRGRVTAVIGPAGAGKTTLLRAFNRTNELHADAVTRGTVRFGGTPIYDPAVEPGNLRRRIGMIFEQPAPFPRTVFDNVAWALRIHGLADELEGRVERALDRAGLWRELADRLHRPATELPPGIQQRLAIARALALEPAVLLLDAPCARLDAGSTAAIEDLLYDLKETLALVLVPHSLRQAARVSDTTVFLDAGRVVETGDTDQVFTRPRRTRTEAFVTGRIG